MLEKKNEIDPLEEGWHELTPFTLFSSFPFSVLSAALVCREHRFRMREKSGGRY